MQTGRRTGASALRTGAAPAKSPGGVGGILQKWNALDSKMKTIIMVVAAVLVVAAIAINMYAASAKPVALYATAISSSDVQAISNKLSQWGIPHELAEGGTNVLVAPKYKYQSRLRLAALGLPNRPIITSNIQEDGGIAPPTREEKKQKALLQLTGDIIETIRQIDGVADAYVKIVPKSRGDWGGGEGSNATAAIMLKLTPGAKLNKSQIAGILNYVAFAVEGLKSDNIKIVDTTGKILNNMAGTTEGMAGGSDNGEYATLEMKEKIAVEERFAKKVRSSLGKILGPDRYEVQVSVDMDFSQRETTKEKHGGPASVEGRVISGVSSEKESYKTDPGKGGGGGVETMSDGSEKMDYGKFKITKRFKVDKTKTRVVDTSHKVKRITCGVMVNGVTDPKKLAKIESFVKNSISFNGARGDSVSVSSFPFTMTQMADEMSANPFAGSPGSFAGSPGRSTTQLAPWMLMLLGIPVILLILMVALFYMKQKNVQKEKQRLILTSGPGATVSDISDLLADKEGKVTAPEATKVNTTDQLEKLAKEKPTKVAELLKSTWLADK
ncbi:MAG: flagellar M-ring protein FliF [Candidatus Eremiobacteraeota bacterium]|nr:flagellar M-ring protein FliF [Candidatus Eremiobacteraeota bacterium]